MENSQYMCNFKLQKLQPVFDYLKKMNFLL